MRRFSASLGGNARKLGGYRLELSDDQVIVAFESGETPFFGDATGFHEGLWRFDCAELFLANPANGRYVEFNFSPSGALWCCAFSAPRQRDTSVQPPNVRFENAEIRSDGWTLEVSLDWSDIEAILGSREGLKGNVTLILGGCPDENPPLENLLTVAPLTAVDFHRPHEWLPLEELQTAS